MQTPPLPGKKDVKYVEKEKKERLENKQKKTRMEKASHEDDEARE